MVRDVGQRGKWGGTGRLTANFSLQATRSLLHPAYIMKCITEIIKYCRLRCTSPFTVGQFQEQVMKAVRHLLMSLRFLNRITIQYPIAPLMDREIHYTDKVYRWVIERPFTTRNLLLDGKGGVEHCPVIETTLLGSKGAWPDTSRTSV